MNVNETFWLVDVEPWLFHAVFAVGKRKTMFFKQLSEFEEVLLAGRVELDMKLRNVVEGILAFF